MIKEVIRQLKDHLALFPQQDKIIFNNQSFQIDKTNFEPIHSAPDNSKSIAFVDGGQAEIISAGNLCLSFIRIGAIIVQDNKKINNQQHEFYLLTTAASDHGDLIYKSKLFSDQPLIDEKDLIISSRDATIKIGGERASINTVTSMARRFAELALAAKMKTDIVVLDGTLEPTFRNEEVYLSKLPGNVCALAKSSSLFTASGNSPVVLLNKASNLDCWCYSITPRDFFVKLHPKSKHVFRYTGKKEFLPALLHNSTDALFLGYPYGLIAADKLARVSNEEKKSVKMNILLRAENKDLVEYLSTTNAHDILDNLG